MKRIFILVIIISILSLTGCKITVKAGVTKNQEDLKKSESSLEGHLMKNMKEKIDKLSLELVHEKNPSIEIVLEDFMKKEKENVVLIYFVEKGTGTFYCNPSMELPEDYDGRERPWYIKAKEEAYYISDPYKDFTTNKDLQTISKAIYKNGKLLGVVGIDLVVEDIK